jgi:hypothetical protein
MAGEDIASEMSRFAQPKSLYLADAADALSAAALQQVLGSPGEALGLRTADCQSSCLGSVYDG